MIGVINRCHYHHWHIIEGPWVPNWIITISSQTKCTSNDKFMCIKRTVWFSPDLLFDKVMWQNVCSHLTFSWFSKNICYGGNMLLSYQLYISRSTCLYAELFIYSNSLHSWLLHANKVSGYLALSHYLRRAIKEQCNKVIESSVGLYVKITLIPMAKLTATYHSV